MVSSFQNAFLGPTRGTNCNDNIKEYINIMVIQVSYNKQNNHHDANNNNNIVNVVVVADVIDATQIPN